MLITSAPGISQQPHTQIKVCTVKRVVKLVSQNVKDGIYTKSQMVQQDLGRKGVSEAISECNVYFSSY